MGQRFITVFCSANDLSESYKNPVREFANLMTQNGFGLVWGGSDTGLMKLVADVVKSNGGKVIGITTPIFAGIARKDADEMIVAHDLDERKHLLIHKGNAIAILVGGIGTLDELSEAAEAIEQKREGKHDKPIVFLNTDNFYEGIKDQFHKMEKGGMLTGPMESFLHFAKTPKEAMDYILTNLNK